MTEPIVLPPGVAVAILAFLLSLLPAGLFLWVWYLRHHKRPVSGMSVALAFLSGIVLVYPAFLLERWAGRTWVANWPDTAHYFEGAVLPLQTLGDVLWPALGTFLIVALVEEGLRFLLLLGWFRFSSSVDQVFDGLLIGLAAGLGFATLENTLYFFELFSAGSFNTLVFVFFLRFLVSTIAHVSFGAIMGSLLAKGLFSIYRPRLIIFQAFLWPWFLHGLYDWLLGVNLTLYAVLMLLPALLVVINWAERREFFVVNRAGKEIIVDQQPPHDHAEALRDLHKGKASAWNKFAPWLRPRRQPTGDSSTAS